MDTTSALSGQLNLTWAGIIIPLLFILLIFLVFYLFKSPKRIGGELLRDFGLASIVGISFGAATNNELWRYSPYILVSMIIMLIGIHLKEKVY